MNRERWGVLLLCALFLLPLACDADAGEVTLQVQTPEFYLGANCEPDPSMGTVTNLAWIEVSYRAVGDTAWSPLVDMAVDSVGGQWYDFTYSYAGVGTTEFTTRIVTKDGFDNLVCPIGSVFEFTYDERTPGHGTIRVKPE